MDMMQVFICFFTLAFAYGFPLEEYYIKGGGAYPNQEFYYNYQLQPLSANLYPSDINKPEFHPELGMSPQYHDLVYNYVKDFAGTQSPQHVPTFQPFIFNSQQIPTEGGSSEFTNGANINLESGGGEKDAVTVKPELNNYFLPSDFFSVAQKSQFPGQFDAINTKRTNPKVYPTSLPPLGGVISNYVLLRNQKNPQTLTQLFGKENNAMLQHIKRQTTDISDGVEILAEPQSNNKMSEEVKEEMENNNEEEQMEAHPGIAQSKPSAIALVGPGGMAQASPVGTALVGQGGLAVAAPSGTAVAGPAGQGAIPIQIGGEKQKKDVTEKSEEADAY